MKHQQSAKRDLFALPARDDPVDLHGLAGELDLTAAQDRVRRMIAAEHRPSPLGRRSPVRFRVAGAVAVAAAAVGVAVVFTGGAGPELTSASAMTIKRAVQALQPIPGAILHIDETTTSSYPGGHHQSWNMDTWQQLSGCGNVVTLGARPGIPTGTETATINHIDEVYDPVRNTIYVDSADPAAGVHARLPSGALVRVPCGGGFSTLADELRQQLASGVARVEGHATIDGRDTIKIVIASMSITYYLAADGSYAPVEQVDADGPDGITTMVYHAFAQLPAAGNGDLVSLTAQHPAATVDNSPVEYTAAIARLSLNG